MGLPSNREVGFVGITVQDSGRLIFNSHYGEADDTWVVTVSITISFSLDSRIHSSEVLYML